MREWAATSALQQSLSLPREALTADGEVGRAGWAQSRAASGPMAPPCSGTLPQNQALQMVRDATLRRACSQGDPPLLVPQVSAGDNGV